MNARRAIEKPCLWVAAHHPLVVFIWWALVAACMLVSCEPVLAHAGPTAAGSREGPAGGGDARPATRANVAQRAASGEYTP